MPMTELCDAPEFRILDDNSTQILRQFHIILTSHHPVQIFIRVIAFCVRVMPIDPVSRLLINLETEGCRSVSVISKIATVSSIRLKIVHD